MPVKRTVDSCDRCHKPRADHMNPQCKCPYVAPAVFRCFYCSKPKLMEDRARPYGVSIPNCCVDCKPAAERAMMLASARNKGASNNG